MADNTTAGAIAAGVGTANNVQFGSVISGGGTLTNGSNTYIFDQGVYGLRPDKSTPLRVVTLFTASLGSPQWSYGFRNTGTDRFYLFSENQAGTDSGATLQGGASEHEFFNSWAANNVAAVKNADATGYSACRFLDNGGNEKMAIGYGNPSGITVTADRSFIETSGGGSTAPALVINQSTDYGNPGVTPYQLNNRMVFDLNGTIRFLKKFNTDSSLSAADTLFSLEPDTGALTIGPPAGSQIKLDPAHGVKLPSVDIVAISAATAGAGSIVYYSGRVYASNGTSWVLL